MARVEKDLEEDVEEAEELEEDLEETPHQSRRSAPKQNDRARNDTSS